MTPAAAPPLTVDLAAWPGVVLRLGGDGTVVASNGWLETRLGARVLGRRFEALLEEDASLAKWRKLVEATREASRDGGPARTRDGDPPVAITRELVFCTADRALEPLTLSILREGDELSLVEQPAPVALLALGAEVAEVNAELTTAQRALVIERARLASALREVERSNHALDEFAQVVSHDLKAPLRAIHEYAGLLVDPASALTAEEREEFLPRIGELTRRMRAMIDGALSYARAGRPGHRVEPVDMSALLRELVLFLAPPAGVQIDVAPGLPMVEAERVPLEQVFRNLLSNAVAYRRAEGARITVDARDAGDAWEFLVADNGPGIPEGQREKIWRLFHTSRPGEGTGLGLALVRRIVEGHGGTVRVESVVGEGSTFHVRWPKRPAAPAGLRGATDGQS